MINEIRYKEYVNLTEKIFTEIQDTNYHNILNKAAKLADEGKYVESTIHYFDLYRNTPTRNLASLVNNRLIVFASKANQRFEDFLLNVTGKGFYHFLCPHTISLIERLANKKYLKPLHTNVEANVRSTYAYDTNAMNWPPNSNLKVQELVSKIGKGSIVDANNLYQKHSEEINLKIALSEACFQKNIKAFNLILNSFGKQSEDMLEYMIYSVVKNNDYKSLEFILSKYPNQTYKAQAFTVTLFEQGKDVSNILYSPLKDQGKFDPLNINNDTELQILLGQLNTEVVSINEHFLNVSNYYFQLSGGKADKDTLKNIKEKIYSDLFDELSKQEDFYKKIKKMNLERAIRKKLYGVYDLFIFPFSLPIKVYLRTKKYSANINNTNIEAIAADKNTLNGLVSLAIQKRNTSALQNLHKHLPTKLQTILIKKLREAICFRDLETVKFLAATKLVGAQLGLSLSIMYMRPGEYTNPIIQLFENGNGKVASPFSTIQHITQFETKVLENNCFCYDNQKPLENNDNLELTPTRIKPIKVKIEEKENIRSGITFETMQKEEKAKLAPEQGLLAIQEILPVIIKKLNLDQSEYNQMFFIHALRALDDLANFNKDYSAMAALEDIEAISLGQIEKPNSKESALILVRLGLLKPKNANSEKGISLYDLSEEELLDCELENNMGNILTTIFKQISVNDVKDIQKGKQQTNADEVYNTQSATPTNPLTQISAKKVQIDFTQIPTKNQIAPYSTILQKRVKALAGAFRPEANPKSIKVKAEKVFSYFIKQIENTPKLKINIGYNAPKKYDPAAIQLKTDPDRFTIGEHSPVILNNGYKSDFWKVYSRAFQLAKLFNSNKILDQFAAYDLIRIIKGKQNKPFSSLEHEILIPFYKWQLSPIKQPYISSIDRLIFEGLDNMIIGKDLDASLTDPVLKLTKKNGDKKMIRAHKKLKKRIAKKEKGKATDKVPSKRKLLT